MKREIIRMKERIRHSSAFISMFKLTKFKNNNYKMIKNKQNKKKWNATYEWKSIGTKLTKKLK